MGWAWKFIVATIALFCTDYLDAEHLYSAEDDVILLNVTSFNGTVLGTSNAWLVEFYSSWCGHCIRYAPFYKQLATDVKGIVHCRFIVVTDTGT